MELEKLVELLKVINAMNGNETGKQEAVTETDPLIGKLVILRTYASGVHFGTLLKQKERVVELKDARRLWYWNKAFTLNQVAINGVGEDSKVSLPVEFIRILDGIEIIPITKDVYRNLCKYEKDMSK